MDARLTGEFQGEARLSRCATQMSFPPTPPGRLDEKYRLSPSLEIAGLPSLNGELITGPRLVGGDQLEYFCALTNSPETATSRTAVPKATTVCNALIGCP